MYILSGSFVTPLSKENKFYPIDVYMGGRIGTIKLYFDTREYQDEWIIEL